MIELEYIFGGNSIKIKNKLNYILRSGIILLNEPQG